MRPSFAHLILQQPFRCDLFLARSTPCQSTYVHITYQNTRTDSPVRNCTSRGLLFMPPPSLRLWSSLPRLRTRVSNLRSRLQRRHSAGSTKEATEAPLVGIKTDEEILGANEGEYCPINVGTVLKGGEGEIFEAVRKLGWGVNSTVWVGRNRFADRYSEFS